MKIIYDPRVEKVIRRLSKKDNAKVIEVIDLFLYGEFDLSTLYLKKLTRRIWELRAGRYRLLFGTVGSIAIITNIFLKKTQKTPKWEISLAIQRLGQYEK